MMSQYENKKAARIERMKERAAKKREFANNNDLSLFGEAKSGIPLGQPILVGHHSERRHRRHLERIENKVRKGYEAAKEADNLESRIESAESRTAIDSDNPDAANLIQEKIKKLEANIEKSKRINKLLRPLARIDVHETIEHFKQFDDEDSKFIIGYLEPRTHFYACKETRMFSLGTTNDGAEIRRLKKRLIIQAKIDQGFDPFEINGIKVELVDGQVQINFGFKPNEETRSKLKTYPLAMKWSSYSMRWVRKYTGATMGQYFRQELTKLLHEAKP